MSKRQIAALAAVVLVPVVVLVIVLISIGSSGDDGGGTTTESSAPAPQSENSPPGQSGDSGSPAGAPGNSSSGGIGKRRSAPAPNVTVPVLSGGSGPLAKKVAPATSDKKLALGKLRGTPVAVNLWSSWCEPCRSGIRVVQAASQHLAERGVLFLGFAVQDKTADARRFQKTFGITFPTAQDPTGDAARRLGAKGLPATFFISSDGQIVGQVLGPATLGEIELGAAAAEGGNTLGIRQGGIQVPLR
jgi:thiol-disulfide isomerase/thioredoxin